MTKSPKCSYKYIVTQKVRGYNCDGHGTRGRIGETSNKHGLDFETAQLVFDDPLAVSRSDSYPDEERWQTVGAIERAIVLVIHTWPVYDQESDEEVGRIISARKATKSERRAYEEGNF